MSETTRRGYAVIPQPYYPETDACQDYVVMAGTTMPNHRYEQGVVVKSERVEDMAFFPDHGQVEATRIDKGMFFQNRKDAESHAAQRIELSAARCRGDQKRDVLERAMGVPR